MEVKLSYLLGDSVILDEIELCPPCRIWNEATHPEPEQGEAPEAEEVPSGLLVAVVVAAAAVAQVGHGRKRPCRTVHLCILF